MANDRIKLLYIAGWGRSGSTVLSAILGQADGLFSAGEIHQIWNNGLLDNEPCSCGDAFSECNVWSSVIQESYGGFERIDPARMIQYQNESVRIRQLPRLAFSSKQNSFSKDYLDSLDHLYKAIYKVTGSKVIVDSSKDGVYVQALKNLPSFDVYVLHLVRDPRAVAFSWQRTKQIIPGHSRVFSRKGSVQSALKWLIVNWTIQLLHNRGGQPYLRVRYEDFISQPSVILAEILRFIGEEDLNPSLMFGQEMELKVNHMIAGNPMRFQRGALKLSPDVEWMSNMKKQEKALVSLLTFPLLTKYKY